MMQESERIARIKESVEKELMQIPGVHAVGIGPKLTNWEVTGEIAIHVLLPQKKPVADLNPEHVIPPEIEGIKTDILEIPGFVVSTGLPDRDSYRPLKGGVQIEARGANGTGTLGCLAKTTDDPIQVVALSNHHVLFAGIASGPSCNGCTSGSDVGQPTAASSDFIGTNLRGFANEQIDAAIAIVNDGTQYLAEIQDFGLISSVRSTPVKQDELLQMIIQVPPQKFFVNKRGKQTGLTRGWLASARLNGGPIRWPDGTTQREHYVNQLLIVPPDLSGMPGPPPAGGPPMSQSGDSGSLVLDDNHQAVGLMFGEVTDPTNPFNGSILACQITDVQSQLHIAIETATVANDVRTASTVHAPAHSAPSPAPSHTPAPVFRVSPVLVRVEEELSEIPQGEKYISLLRKHAREIHDLINNNRRVATVWLRCKGPKILEVCLRIAENHSQSLPTEIEGVPLRVSLVRFGKILERYGSRLLAADVKTVSPSLAILPGKSYLEIKQALAKGEV
jgi:hypothetical protein